MTGGTLTGNIYARSNIWFNRPVEINTDEGTTTENRSLCAIMVSGNASKSHFYFRQRNSLNTDQYEQFALPDSAKVLGSNSYNILTTKNGINDIINEEVKTAQSLAEALNKDKYPVYFNQGNIYFKKINRMVLMSGYEVRSNLSITTGRIVGLLPSEYLPSITTYCYLGNSSVLGQFVIRPDGKLQIYPVTGSFLPTQNLNFTTIYFTN